MNLKKAYRRRVNDISIGFRVRNGEKANDKLFNGIVKQKHHRISLECSLTIDNIQWKYLTLVHQCALHYAANSNSSTNNNNN